MPASIAATGTTTTQNKRPTGIRHLAAAIYYLIAGFVVVGFFASYQQIKSFSFSLVSSQQHASSSHPHIPHGDGRCVGLGADEDLDTLIASSQLLFVVAPDKAAGTTMQSFTKHCVGTPVKNVSPCLNKFNCAPQWLHSTTKYSTYVDQVEAPRIVATHATQDQTVIRMMHNSNRHTVILYLHREETDRLVSAIKQVVYRRMKAGILPEDKLIELIKARDDEIKHGQQAVLTCDFYAAVKENSPNLIFVNYKQANRLQHLLSKHFCPQLLATDPIEENVDKKKTRKKFSVQLASIPNKTEGAVVELDEWLEGKRHILEWALDMRSATTCSGKTKHMEDALLGCSDEAITNDHGNWL